jgi:hypothetical protein
MKFELIVGFLFAVSFIFSLKKFRAAHNRRSNLPDIANGMGFSLNVDCEKIIKLIKGFNISSSAGSLFNGMQKEQKNVSWSLFEYKWSIDRNDTSKIHYFAALAQIPNKKFTEFHLSPESVLDFGAKDIDFQDYTSFSKKYFLKGPDEDAVRKIFTPRVISFFEKETEKIYIECKDNLFIYYSKKALRPEEYPNFLAKAEQTLSFFT